LAIKFRHDSAPLHVLVGLALLAAEEGNAERAVELWALVSRVSVITTSHFYRELYRQRIAPVAAGLPPEVVAVAEERGRAGDMWATLEGYDS
jgi:hypothetical protein